MRCAECQQEFKRDQAFSFDPPIPVCHAGEVVYLVICQRKECRLKTIALNLSLWANQDNMGDWDKQPILVVQRAKQVYQALGRWLNEFLKLAKE